MDEKGACATGDSAGYDVSVHAIFIRCNSGNKLR